jgi:hypothetical protein
MQDARRLASQCRSTGAGSREDREGLIRGRGRRSGVVGVLVREAGDIPGFCFFDCLATLEGLWSR